MSSDRNWWNLIIFLSLLNGQFCLLQRKWLMITLLMSLAPKVKKKVIYWQSTKHGNVLHYEIFPLWNFSKLKFNNQYWNEIIYTLEYTVYEKFDSKCIWTYQATRFSRKTSNVAIISILLLRKLIAEKQICYSVYYLLIPINLKAPARLLFFDVSITLLSLSFSRRQFVSFFPSYNQRTSPYNFQFLELTDASSASRFYINLLFFTAGILDWYFISDHLFPLSFLSALYSSGR